MKPESKRPQGRPKGPPTVPISIRLTLPQHKAYIERGGARWIKRLIDEIAIEHRGTT